MYDVVVVGCGYAGAVCARVLAEEGNKKVLIIDKRNHIAGNMYDEYDKHGLLVHRYGPHISVMNTETCYSFLSRFTEWKPYEHRVNALILGREVPLPFNFSGLDALFPFEKATELKKILLSEYGENSQVPILDMMKSDLKPIRELADFLYENIFLHYTEKMWGLKPTDIDPSVTARIPVRISYDNRHFVHKYQVMPKDGFTNLFKNMLGHSNITIKLNCDAKQILSLNKNKEVLLNGERFDGTVIYTGAIDELFDYKFGDLPYRSLEFQFDYFNKKYVQETTVLNWPDTRPETRRTEMKHLTQQNHIGTTTITEYPGPYNREAEKFAEPYYPISNNYCNTLYEQYRIEAEQYKKLYMIGRLADYKYYNMEATINRALEVTKRILCNLEEC